MAKSRIVLVLDLAERIFLSKSWPRCNTDIAGFFPLPFFSTTKTFQGTGSMFQCAKLILISTYLGWTSITVSLDGVLLVSKINFEAGKRKSSKRSFINFSPTGKKENCELLPNPIYICGNSSEDVVICYEHSHLPKPFLSTPSQVKRVLINFKCPASSGKLFSVNKYKLNHQNMLHFQCLL